MSKVFEVIPLILSMVIFIGTIMPVQARSLDEIKVSGEIRVCLFSITKTDREYMISASPPGCRDDCTFDSYIYELALALTTK